MPTPPDPSDALERPRDSGAGGSTGKRVFVVEDEFLGALLLEEELLALGFTIVGPFTSVATAIEAARREQFDFAILDINLGGEMVFPLADELSARGVPFLFVSGYGEMNRPERHRGTPCLAKPYEQTGLVRAIDLLLAARRRE